MARAGVAPFVLAVVCLLSCGLAARPAEVDEAEEVPRSNEIVEPAAALEHDANATQEENETAFHCNSFCIACGNGKHIYISRAQSALQIASKLMYLNVYTAAAKITYHMIRAAMSELPNECPNVEMVQVRNSRLHTYDITDDTKRYGSLPLLRKNATHCTGASTTAHSASQRMVPSRRRSLTNSTSGRTSVARMVAMWALTKSTVGRLFSRAKATR
jgi:hypothetical protein